MSVEAITWALKQPVKQSSAKFVLVALANCSDAVERLAWPSIAYLCEATSQDRKTVMENLKRLIVAGFIEDTGRRVGATKSVIVYSLSNPENGTPKQSQERDTLAGEAVPFFPTSSTVFPHKQYRFSAEAVPKTGHGTVRNRKEPSRKEDNVVVADVPASVLQDFLKLRKEKKSPLTNTAIDRMRKEATKAGISLSEAMAICCELGWQGFNSEWYSQRQAKKSQGAETTYQRTMREKFEEASGRNKSKPNFRTIDSQTLMEISP